MIMSIYVLNKFTKFYRGYIQWNWSTLPQKRNLSLIQLRGPFYLRSWGAEGKILTTIIFVSATPHPKCCGQLWVRHMICGQTCDGLYHFVFYLINYTQKSTTSTLAVKLSMSAIFTPRWTATLSKKSHKQAKVVLDSLQIKRQGVSFLTSVLRDTISELILM